MTKEEVLKSELRDVFKMWMTEDFHRIAKHKLEELANRHGVDRVSNYMDRLAKKENKRRRRRMDYWV